MNQFKLITVTFLIAWIISNNELPKFYNNPPVESQTIFHNELGKTTIKNVLFDKPSFHLLCPLCHMNLYHILCTIFKHNSLCSQTELLIPSKNQCNSNCGCIFCVVMMQDVKPVVVMQQAFCSDVIVMKCFCPIVVCVCNRHFECRVKQH